MGSDPFEVKRQMELDMVAVKGELKLTNNKIDNVHNHVKDIKKSLDNFINKVDDDITCVNKDIKSLTENKADKKDIQLINNRAWGIIAACFGLLVTVIGFLLAHIMGKL